MKMKQTLSIFGVITLLLCSCGDPQEEKDLKQLTGEVNGLYDGGPYCGVSDPNPEWHAPDTQSRLWGMRTSREPLYGQLSWRANNACPGGEDGMPQQDQCDDCLSEPSNTQAQCEQACERLQTCACTDPSSSLETCVQNCMWTDPEDATCVLDTSCGQMPSACENVVYRGGVAVSEGSCNAACDRLVECTFYSEDEHTLCQQECLAIGDSFAIECMTREGSPSCLNLTESCFLRPLASTPTDGTHDSGGTDTLSLCSQGCDRGLSCGLIEAPTGDNCVAPCTFHGQRERAQCRIEASCDEWAQCN